ncbi:MAG: FAD-dependent oxidoreductase [Desulfobacterales bacterium]|nr:FAD-dependent oxidoreductase [Desulfobacterales bacterium]
MKTVSTDILVIGGGAAAGMAAFEAAKYGLDVTLVDKGRFSRSGSTPVAASAFSVPLSAGDGQKEQLKDMLRVGENLCDQDLAGACVADSFRILEELDQMGVPLQKDSQGKPYVTQAMGHSMPRNVHFDYDISDPMRILRRQCLHRGVHVHEFVMIIRILTADGRAVGALGLDRQGNLIQFLSRAVILGAGSATALYPHASASLQTTGDAVALALEAGAQVVDMEFVELTLVPKVKGQVVSTGGIGTMVRSGASYLNNRGERFMEKIDPVKKEAAPRYKVVRAVYREISEGRGPVICDFSKVPTRVIDGAGKGNIFLNHKREALGLGTGISQFEWAIAIHRLLGGSRITAEGATDVPGLFAAGESAGGVHGAARLAGHAVLDCFVFGSRAGRSACKFAVHEKPPASAGPPADRSAIGTGRRKAASGANLEAEILIEKIQDIMVTHVSVVRNARSLETAVKKIEALLSMETEKIVSDHPWKPWEARNLLVNAYLVSRAALTREESRGGHFREDYPEHDDKKWLKHIGFFKKDGTIEMVFSPVR